MSISLDALGITPNNIYAFMLVLTRFGGLILLAPLYAGRSVPTQIKLAIALVLSLVMLPTASQGVSLADIGAAHLAALAFKELMVGAALGFAIALVVMAWQLAGAMLDLSIGFGYGGIIDPITGVQTPQLQQLYGMVAIMLFLVLGGHEIMVAALVKTFSVIPLDQEVKAAGFMQLAEGVTIGIFRIGLGVAAPVLIALMLTDMAFALVARVAPQVQVMQVEFPVKILVALLVMLATLAFMGPVFAEALRRGLNLIIGVGGG